MSGWVVGTLILLVWIVLMVALGASATAERKRYHRDVAAWADERGWGYRKGAHGRTWTSPLPRGFNSDVQLQVDGTRDGQPFTIAYVNTVAYGDPTVQVESTVVVMHLPSAYPAIEIKPRTFSFRPTTGTIGHAAFDKKFRVRTRAPGGPAAVVSNQLAEAHVAGEVPLWSLREHELICHTDGKTRVADLDATLDRAVRVAPLLSVGTDQARQQPDCLGPLAPVSGVDPDMGTGQDDHIRISNAERDQAITMLGVHLSTGRLELPEFEDRCRQAAAARTRAEVEQLFGDLPLPHPDLSLAARPSAPIHGPDPLVGKNTSSKPTSELSETPLSSAMETIAGSAFVFGIPGAIALTIWADMGWTFLPVMVTIVLACGLSEAFKKKPNNRA